MSCPGKQIRKNQWPLHAISCFFLNVSMKVWYYLVVVYFVNFVDCKNIILALENLIISSFIHNSSFWRFCIKAKISQTSKAPYQKKNLLYSNENFYTMSLNLRKMELARDFSEQ